MKLIVYNLKQYFSSSKAVFLFNIVGFTVALTVFLVISIQVNYDFSYNKNFEKSNDIYFYNRHHNADGYIFWTINQALAEEYQAKIPEIKSYCLLQFSPNTEISTYTGNSKKEHTATLIQATPGFFNTFTPEVLSGSTERIFDARGKALISEKTALEVFGNTNPVGQAFLVGDSVITVAAIYKDFPENCSLQNGIYTYMTPNTPNNWNYSGYFLIEPDNIDTVVKKINSAEILGEETYNSFQTNPDDKVEMRLSPLTDIYLYGSNKRVNITLSLLGIGIIILLIAYINFINFSISMAPGRVKNINIHKILGVDTLRLRLSIMFEGVIFTILALGLALLCLHFFKSASLASAVVADLSIVNNWQIIAITALGVILFSFLIGIYPAIYTTSFNEAFALKGSFSLSPKGKILRNSLIVFQFTASIALICISGVIKLQNDYMKNYSWGFQKENIVYLYTKNADIDSEIFGNELKQNGSAIDYTSSWNLPGGVGMSWGREFEGKSIDFFSVWPVTPNFLDFFGVKITAGKNFPEERDREKIIFNQEFMKVNGLTEDIIGKEFYGFSPADIVGVVENINFESLHAPIRPMAFVVFPNKAYYDFLYLKLTGTNLPENISRIEQTWKKFTNKPFNPKFLDDSMDKLYKNEVNTGNMISVFGLISVIIAMMGVYGLVLFNTRYKTKEIAIRKINGATEKEVLKLLNRNMLWMLLISFFIAAPIAYFVIKNWLNNFAYKIAMPWWLFIAAALLVLFISVLTVSWQSYRAATANPVESLKSE